jgi:hypothetical protein
MLIAGAGAVEVEANRPGRVRLAAIKDFSAARLHPFVKVNVAPGTTVWTVGWPAYEGASGVAHDPHVIGTMAAHVRPATVAPAVLQPQALGLGRLPRPAAEASPILPR